MCERLLAHRASEACGTVVSMGRRLTQPLVRDNGTLRPAEWEEALDRAADGFDGARGSAAGIFSCSKATNEVNYVAQKLARVALGTNNVDSCNRT
jgi:predicted molibdopterin-dependent oxidoreductase YjgC